MRTGFTTGSCAAAASKAAAVMLLGGIRKEEIRIDTPAGVSYRADVEDICVSETAVSCAVRKDAGDDPDVTNGILIYSKVSFASGDLKAAEIRIRGGSGVGRVTRPGLDQEAGCAAINSVPRKMIEKEVREVMDFFGCRRTLDVEISVPGGEALARKTFNPRLGIEGGISIIGTTGIVEPMSARALLETIRIEIAQKKAMGAEVLVMSPGNYGLSFMKDHYGYDLDAAVKCSNYIGESIDMAADAGFKKLLLCGHIGKLIKVSGGIMNTHSREADARMELMAAAAIRCGASGEILKAVLGAASTEEACGILFSEGIDRACFDSVMERIHFYLNHRAGGRPEAECIMYSNRYGLLGTTPRAEAFLREAMVDAK